MREALAAAVDEAWSLLSAGRVADCLPAFAEALAQLTDQHAALRVRCWAGLGQAAAREGRLLDALNWLEDAARLARAAQVSPSTALIDLGTLHSRLGDPARSLRVASEAVAVHREREEWPRLVQALYNRGYTHQREGRAEQSIADFLAAWELVLAHGLERYAVNVLTALVESMAEAGQIEAARERFAALDARLSARPGSAYQQAHRCWARAHLRLATGEPGALADAVVCLEAAEGSGMTRQEQLAAQLAVRAAVAEQDYEQAWRYERRARELSEALFAARRADALALQASRHRAEVEQLRAAELEAARDEARAVAEARSWVLKVVSHELRTPLNGILGATALLAERLDAPADVSLLSMVRTSGELMMSLVSSLLDAARLEAGVLELAPAPVSLPSLLEETLSMLRPAAAEKGLALSLQLRAGLPEQVVLDARRFQQIVLNLAANAVKFTPAGAVTVCVAPSGPGGLLVLVDDDGPGVAPEDRARIFAPFEQADTGTTRQHGGVGLGLALSRQLAALFGGLLSVSDAPSGGARFVLSIPAPAVAGTRRGVEQTILLGDHRPSSPHSTVGDGGGAGIEVLLVDDDAMCRLVQQAMLQRLGARVRLAASGAAALDAVSARLPDLIVLDWMMPQMDGAEVAAALRARGVTVPIVALTASPAPELARLCSEVGIQAIYTKPVDLSTMAAVLERWRPAREGGLPTAHPTP